MRCKAYQIVNSMYCDHCHYTWDIDDPDKPDCLIETPPPPAKPETIQSVFANLRAYLAQAIQGDKNEQQS